MSEPDDRGAPPLLPNPAPQTPPPAGGSRYVLPIVFLFIAGLFIFGGWIVSAFNQFTSGMTAPARTEFTEVTLRSGDPENRIAVIDVTGIITSIGPSTWSLRSRNNLNSPRRQTREGGDPAD